MTTWNCCWKNLAMWPSSKMINDVNDEHVRFLGHILGTCSPEGWQREREIDWLLTCVFINSSQKKHHLGFRDIHRMYQTLPATCLSLCSFITEKLLVIWIFVPLYFLSCTHGWSLFFCNLFVWLHRILDAAHGILVSCCYITWEFSLGPMDSLVVAQGCSNCSRGFLVAS